MNNVDKAYDFIRVSVETRLGVRSVIAVTSALSIDGSAVVSAGLAEAFAVAGKRTLLVSDGERVGMLKRRPASPVRAETRANLTKTTAVQVATASSGVQTAFYESIPRLRESYDIVIIDSDPLPASSAAYEVAREADAVLIAVRLGRRPRNEDRVTMQLLADCGANVLGIVPTNGQPVASARATADPLPGMPDIDAFALRTKRQAEVL